MYISLSLSVCLLFFLSPSIRNSGDTTTAPGAYNRIRPCSYSRKPAQNTSSQGVSGLVPQVHSSRTIWSKVMAKLPSPRPSMLVLWPFPRSCCSFGGCCRLNDRRANLFHFHRLLLLLLLLHRRSLFILRQAFTSRRETGPLCRQVVPFLNATRSRASL